MPAARLYDRALDQWIDHTWTPGPWFDKRFDVWSEVDHDPAADKAVLVGGAYYLPRFDTFVQSLETIPDTTAPAGLPYTLPFTL